MALFFLVIIPNIIRWVGNRGGNQDNTSDNGIPVQVPLISAPTSATSSAQLPLSGYSEKGFTVVVLDNDQEVKRVNSGDDGTFSTDIDLQKGNNNIAVYAIDESNKQSDKSKEYVVIYDNEPPKLEIQEPQDKQQITGKKNQTLTIKGTTEKNTKVYLNDRLAFVKDDGTFSVLQQLNTGDNALNLKAVDAAGNKTEVSLTVNYHD
jgi:bacillopeptidase F